MSVHIYAFAEDVTLVDEKHRFNSTPPSPGRRVVFPRGTPNFQLTSIIKSAKSRHEKISTLHLVAHGAPGKLFLASCSHPAIDEGGAWWFGALRGHFDATFPLVVIHGCNTASNRNHNPDTGQGWYGHDQGGVGYQFCRVMASATQAIVQAGINTQYNDPMFNMEGPTITVGPNGAAPGAEYAL